MARPVLHRRKRARVVPCIVASLLAAASASAQMHVDERASWLPDEDVARIVAGGARIGTIEFDVGNVFDTADPDEDTSLHRVANHLHLKTHANRLNQILLFHSGDLFEPRQLEESARLLRAEGWISDAVIVPRAYHADSNTVDVLVMTRDSWSLSLNMSFGRGGGQNHFGVGLEEKNLLGTGRKLLFSHKSDVDRQQNILGFRDENIFGSRVALESSYADTSDGSRMLFSAGRPFYSLDTRWSVTSLLLDDQRTDHIYERGEILADFARDAQFYALEGGWSAGVVDGRVNRWLVGLTYDQNAFAAPLDSANDVLLPEDRKLVYPWIGFQRTEDDFRQLVELNDMGRTEDVQLGLNVRARLGYAATALGSDRNAWIADVTAAKGWEPSEKALVTTDLAASTRYEHGQLANSILSGGARYYRKTLPKQLFVASIEAATTRRLDLDRQILLGGDSGLRGFPLRYQSGTSRAVATLEERFFTDWYPFHLVRVGYAAFVDAGRTWGTDAYGARSDGMLYDVGIGLRLSSPRASGHSVVHVDLAFPLNSDRSIDGVQLNIETKSSF